LEFDSDVSKLFVFLQYFITSFLITTGTISGMSPEFEVFIDKIFPISLVAF
jgi:hypothetical protein